MQACACAKNDLLNANMLELQICSAFFVLLPLLRYFWPFLCAKFSNLGPGFVSFLSDVRRRYVTSSKMRHPDNYDHLCRKQRERDILMCSGIRLWWYHWEWIFFCFFLFIFLYHKVCKRQVVWTADQRTEITFGVGDRKSSRVFSLFISTWINKWLNKPTSDVWEIQHI